MNVLIHSSVPTLGFHDLSSLSHLESSLNLLIETIAFRKAFLCCFSSEDLEENLSTFNDGDLAGFYQNVLESINDDGAYSSNDIANYVYRFFETSPKVEDLLEIEIASFSDTNLTPHEMIEKWPNTAVDTLSNIIIKIVFCNLMNLNLGFLLNYEGNFNQLRLDSNLEEVLYKDSNVVKFSPQRSLSANFPISNCCELANTMLSAETLWEQASSVKELKTAIFVKAKAMKSSLKYEDFKVGSEFYVSLTRNSAANNSSYASCTLNKCARLVAGQENPSYLRTSRNNASPPVKREADDATATRLHVTSRGPGYRLLAWRLNDGSYELANFGPKNELQIVEGNITERA